MGLNAKGIRRKDARQEISTGAVWATSKPELSEECLSGESFFKPGLFIPLTIIPLTSLFGRRIWEEWWGKGSIQKIVFELG
jgi:hypothetical protein